MILLSVGRTAKLLGVSRLVVKRLIEQGQLEAVLLSNGPERRHYRVTYESAVRLLRQNSQPGGRTMLPNDTEAFARQLRDTCLPGLDRLGKRPLAEADGLREKISALLLVAARLENRLGRHVKSSRPHTTRLT